MFALGAARLKRVKPALGSTTLSAHLRGAQRPLPGESKFTTWAYKFALLEAAVKLRRRAWQGRELPLEPEAWSLFPTRDSSPQESAEQGVLLDELQSAIANELTPHQREVLVATTLNGIPIDVLAERLNTTRGALYKTLHDARHKLRGRLAAQGMSIAAEGREEA